MKQKIALLALLILAAGKINSQDIGVTSITSPVTGCALTTTENVVVRIFNYGSDMSGVPFDVSYTINGGAPVTDVGVVFASFLTNSTITYTVSVPANLSAPGTYTLTASATTAGDVNMTNDMFSNYQVTNSATSAGGTVSSSANVCISGNSGNLTLAGQTGNVLNWEYSTDGGFTWISISNTSTTQPYNNVIINTNYRAKVQSGSCPAAFSSTVTLTVDAATVGGSTGASSNVCSGINSGNIVLSGNTGSVLNWEFSTDGGVTWTPIANTTSTQSYLNLVVTTRYRAVVQNGSCPSANSSSNIKTVNPPSVGGTITPDTSFACSGSNSGTLTLSGHTGSITRWEFSPTGGAPWTNIVNTTTTQNYTNLVSTRYYRARITSGACAAAYSDTAIVIVSSVTTPGSLSSNATVCEGNNTGTITLAGQTGNVLNWEFSIDNGASWGNIVNVTTSETYNNLTQTTLYRAQVQNGTCTAAYSDTVTITVDSASVGGTIATSTTVCSGANSGTLILSGQTGSVVGWENSTDGGITWSPIANLTTSQAYLNLTGTTDYRVLVREGVCPNDTSTIAIITVDSLTLGGVVNVGDTVCSGNNSGTLNLSAQRGNVLSWESSSDGGLTWISIANVTTSQGYVNLTTTTQYRAEVQNGVCPADYSVFARILVDQNPVGGTTYGATTVCSGANSGTITLIGNTGTISNWESSTDNGTTWTPIANTTTIENYTNLLDTTIYRAIISSGSCPNDTSSSVTVLVDAVSIGGVVTLNDTVCAGANAGTVNLIGQIGNVTNWQISTDNGTTWIPISNTTTSQSYLNLSTTTQYRSEVKSGVCPSATSNAVEILVVPQSLASALSSAATVCEGANNGILSSTGNTGTILDWEISTDGITWLPLTNSSSTQAYSNLVDTTYYHTIVQNAACAPDTSAALKITVNPKPLAAFLSDTVCLGNSISFVNSTTSPAGFIQLYSWDFGDNNTSVNGNPTHVYADSGSYNVTLVALSSLGCLDTFILPSRVNALPSVVFTLNGNTSFCAGDSLQISVPLAANTDYLWNTGSTSNAITVDTSGTFVIVAIDTITGCSASDSVTSILFPAAVANAGLDDSISLGNSITLAGTGGISYSWLPSATLDNPSSPQPVATPTANTTYTLTISDVNGCQSIDSVRITVELDGDFVIPTLITPNGDGFNDLWVIKNLQFYSDNEVIIFNRNGQKVFSMTNYDNAWGGTYNGSLLPDGTYYYIIKVPDIKDFKGAITILRSK